MEYTSCFQSGQFDHRLAYRDFSNVDEQDWVKASTIKNDNFPAKLHYVLSEMEKEGLQHVASWQTHGRCFFVHDKNQFTQNILRLWFRQSKYDSFQRQLNTYGFVRITSGPDTGGYYHELFLRGKIFLTRGIHRKKSRERSCRREANSQTINLYEFPWLPNDSSKQSDMNLVSPSHSIIFTPSRLPSTLPLTLQRPNDFKSPVSMKVDVGSASELSPQPRQHDFSLLFQHSCVIQTGIPTLPCTWNLSLVEMMFQQLKSNSSCASANI